MVIIVGIFIFSALCWSGLVKDIGLKVLKHAEKESSTVYNSNSSHKNGTDEEKTSNTKNSHFLQKIDQKTFQLENGWYNHVFQKERLSKIDSVFTYVSIGKIFSNQVVLGENGWLFYKSTTDGDSIADYEGTNRYSEVEKNDILENIIDTQTFFEKEGIKMMVIVTPNKENVYAEYMPDTYQHAEKTSTDILIDYLKKRGAYVVSPKEALLEKHSDMQLYYSYDTHWNQLGAYIGTREVLKNWKIDIPELDKEEVKSSNLRDNYHTCGDDDLARLVGLRNFFDDEIEYEVEGTIKTEWKLFAKEQKTGMSYFKNENALISKKIFLVGDSFRTSMIPVLRKIFAEVYVVHRDCYTAKMIDEIKPEYLMVEYVERYSSELKKLKILFLQ